MLGKLLFKSNLFRVTEKKFNIVITYELKKETSLSYFFKIKSSKKKEPKFVAFSY